MATCSSQVYRRVLLPGMFGLALAANAALATEEKAQFTGAFAFHEGLATVEVDGKLGYIDTSGKVVIAPAYDMAGGFTQGRAPVRQGERTFLIDRNGARLSEDPAPFLLYFPDDSPLAQFYETDSSKKARWGFKNKQGQVVIKPRFDSVGRFNEGLAPYAVNDPSMPGSRERWGYIDLQGKVVIPATFQVSLGFSEGLAKAIQDYRHFFIDTHGQRAFDGDFTFAFDFSQGLAAVNIAPPTSKDALNVVEPGKWGYIDTRGKFVIPAELQQAFPFVDGFAKAQLNGKWGLIDRQGRFVIEPRFDAIDYPSEGLVRVQMPDAATYLKWGLVDMQARLLVPASFDRIMPFSEGFAMVSTGGKRGYIDHAGKYVWEPTK